MIVRRLGDSREYLICTNRQALHRIFLNLALAISEQSDKILLLTFSSRGP